MNTPNDRYGEKRKKMKRKRILGFGDVTEKIKGEKELADHV